jgi:hypothetical protein
MAQNNPAVIIRSPQDRGRAVRWVEQAPVGTVVEFKQKGRSNDQNSAMWSVLTQINKQRPVHNGVRMSAVLWKAVFMQALGAELVMLPTLEGAGLFPFGHRSSKLTVSEMGDLIELMLAWAATQGLTIEHFDDPQEVAA